MRGIKAKQLLCVCKFGVQKKKVDSTHVLYMSGRGPNRPFCVNLNKEVFPKSK